MSTVLPVGTRVKSAPGWEWFFKGSEPLGTIERACIDQKTGSVVYVVVMDGNDKPHYRRDRDGGYYCSKHTHQCRAGMVEALQ
jgi:hypothetical protein